MAIFIAIRRFDVAQYSVAKAKDGLSALIAKAQAGEEVIITNHGKPVAELRTVGSQKVSPRAMHDWLKKQRDKRPSVNISSVDLINQMYEDYRY
jgi:prevent-host-death family protein